MESISRQIIAVGGGLFSAETADRKLERYILAQARAREPAVAFVPTASGDDQSYIIRFYAALSGFSCRLSHLSLFTRTPDLRRYLLAQDIICIGGGNTKSMLAVWREWGMPEVLREAWESGIVLAGSSAGALCWFEQGVTDSYADRLLVLTGLGFLSGSCCPHYDAEPERRPSYHQLLLNREIGPGIAIEDKVAVHFIDDRVHRVVASRDGAKAYRVGVQRNTVLEEPLPIDYDAVSKQK